MNNESDNIPDLNEIRQRLKVNMVYYYFRNPINMYPRIYRSKNSFLDRSPRSRVCSMTQAPIFELVQICRTQALLRVRKWEGTSTKSRSLPKISSLRFMYQRNTDEIWFIRTDVPESSRRIPGHFLLRTTLPRISSCICEASTFDFTIERSLAFIIIHVSFSFSNYPKEAL